MDWYSRCKLTSNRDMSASKVSDSRKREMLEKEIEYKRKSLQAYATYINRKDDENICVLEAKKFKKEVELKKCYTIQFWAKSILMNDILNLQRRIDELKSLEERKNELEELKRQLSVIPKHAENAKRGYPESLDGKLFNELKPKFTGLPLRLTPKVPFMNIIMIGETGSGKSCFLKTFTTALKGDITSIYRTCPSEGREESATKKIHFEPLKMGDDGPILPCRFFDMPGIHENESIKKDELKKILNGEIKLNVKMHQETDLEIEIQKPNPADVVHCILYVIKASKNLKEMKACMISMTEFLKEQHSEDGVRQFVVVTSIDKLGVPNSDMKNAYKYPSVHKYCNEVSVAFDVDLSDIIPVSNYFEEVAPNDAKNAMSLYSLWRVFVSTKEHIERRWLKGETIMISKELSFKINRV